MSEIREISRDGGKSALSVALIGPDETRRRMVAEVLSGGQPLLVREFSAYPVNLGSAPRLPEQDYDIFIVELDSDPDAAFRLIESVCASGSGYVMAYSTQADLQLAVRFMRAGVRELFTLPLDPAEVAAALERAAQHPLAGRRATRAAGKVYVFLGSKGGCGVTTVASNFAVSLARESGRSTLLVDLVFPLGDAALNLGISPQYSVANALQDLSRLDERFLATLVAKHDSGLSVLAAPGQLTQDELSSGAVDRLLDLACRSFDQVVIDAGTRIDLMNSTLFEKSSTVYLVTQVGISELRNSNRLISRFFATWGRSLQVVLNRYTPNALLFDDAQIAKALTRPAQWMIPDDYVTARRTRNAATPIAMGHSSIAQAIRQMARAACGLPVEEEKKKGVFRFIRAIWERATASGKRTDRIA